MRKFQFLGLDPSGRRAEPERMEGPYHPNTNDGRRVLICLCSQIQNYIPEADADLIPVPGRLESRQIADVVSCCLHALVLYLLQI